MKLSQVRKHTAEIQAIAQKHRISAIYVFGSTSRGEANETSDVDFLVELEKDAGLFGVAGFQYECEKLLGVRVDVVPKSLLGDLDHKQFSIKILEDSLILC